MHPGSLHKVLALRLSSIGDVLLATPFLRVFRQRYPGCELHFVVRSEFAELLRHNPHIDRLIGVDVSTGRRGLEELNHELIAEHYDAVFDLQNNFRSRLLTNGLPKLRRVDKRQLPRFVLVHFGVDLYRDETPVPERYIQTAEQYGVCADLGGPELHLPAGVEQEVHLRMRSKGLDPAARIIGVCPGSKHATKQWPLEHYRELLRLLLEGEGSVAVFGGPEDTAAGETLEAVDRTRVHSFCGSFSLAETASAMDSCAAIVANDSGLMHMATARRRPVVAIFGSTTRHLGFFPYNSTASVLETAGLTCRPCSHIGRPRCPKRHFRCMMDIHPRDVADALHSL